MELIKKYNMLYIQYLLKKGRFLWLWRDNQQLCPNIQKLATYSQWNINQQLIDTRPDQISNGYILQFVSITNLPASHTQQQCAWSPPPQTCCFFLSYVHTYIMSSIQPNISLIHSFPLLLIIFIFIFIFIFISSIYIILRWLEVS